MGCATSKPADEQTSTTTPPATNAGDAAGDKRGAANSRFTTDISGQQLTVMPNAKHTIAPRRLAAKNNLLSRTHPEFAKEYASIEEIDFSSNRFTRIPEALAQLPRLTALDMSYNTFAKAGACDVVPSLLRLTSLSCAAVGFKLLPPPLLASRTLVTLDLSRNPGLNLAKVPLDRLSSLRTLSVAYCELSGPPPAGIKVVKLTTLTISGNPGLELNDPKAFGNGQRSLNELVADDMNWRELPRAVCTCNALRVVSLRSNPLETVSGVGFLAVLASLDVSYCGLVGLPKDLEQAEHLTTLIADGNAFRPPRLDVADEVDLHPSLGGYARLLGIPGLARLSVAQPRPVPAELVLAASQSTQLQSISWTSADGVGSSSSCDVLPLCLADAHQLGEVNHKACHVREIAAEVTPAKLLASILKKHMPPTGESPSVPPLKSPSSSTGTATIAPTRWVEDPKRAVANFESWLRAIDGARNALNTSGFAQAAQRYLIAFDAVMIETNRAAASGGLLTPLQGPAKPPQGGAAQDGANAGKTGGTNVVGSQADGYFALVPQTAGSNNTSSGGAPGSGSMRGRPGGETSTDGSDQADAIVPPLDVAVIHLAIVLKRFAATRHDVDVNYGALPPTPPGNGCRYWSSACSSTDHSVDAAAAKRWRAAVMSSCSQRATANERQTAADWNTWNNPMALADVDDSSPVDYLGQLRLTEADVKRVFTLAGAVAAASAIAGDGTTSTYTMLLGAASAHREAASTKVYLSLEHQLAMILHSIDTDAFVRDCVAAGLTLTVAAPGRVTDYFDSSEAALGRTVGLWETLYGVAFRGAGSPGIVGCWA